MGAELEEVRFAVENGESLDHLDPPGDKYADMVQQW
jgi:hypothetical protein